MTSTKQEEQIAKVEMAKDLTIFFDFEKKVIRVESETWKVISDKEEDEEIVPNKKVQLSNDEKMLSYIIEVFDQIAETSQFGNNSVYYKAWQNALENKKLISGGYQEFTKYLNMALSKDMIEVINDDPMMKGFYRRLP